MKVLTKALYVGSLQFRKTLSSWSSSVLQVSKHRCTWTLPSAFIPHHRFFLECCMDGSHFRQCWRADHFRFNWRLHHHLPSLSFIDIWGHPGAFEILRGNFVTVFFPALILLLKVDFPGDYACCPPPPVTSLLSAISAALAKHWGK